MIESCVSNPAINCSFFLFQYGKTIVEINLVGAALPILLSAFILALYRKRLHWMRVGKFILAGFAIITGIGTAWGAITGSIGIPEPFFILFWLLILVWYSKLDFPTEGAVLTAGELYVIGTLGVTLDDAVRTILGFLSVPVLGLRINPDIWGAGGPIDGIFLSGMSLAITYLIMVKVPKKERTPLVPQTHQSESSRV